MRSLIVVALLVLFAVSSQVGATTLWFTGDGTSANPVTLAAGANSQWPMSPEGHGGKETTLQQVGNGNDENTPNNKAIPTFVWPDSVSISADAPVLVSMFVEDPWGGLCGGMDGQLFDGAGTVLGPAAGVLVDTLGGPGVVEEIVFAFEGISGTYAGLQFQVAGHWSDCSSLPYTFSWGSDAYPARLEYKEPAPAAAASTVYSNLTGARLVQGFENATTGVYVYNLTNDLSPVDLHYDVAGNGTVAVLVLDGNGTAVLNETFTASGNGTQSLAQAAAGNWTYQLTLDNFTGKVTLDLSALAVAAPAPTTTSTTSTTSTASSSTAADAPGLGFAVMLALLVAATVTRRRLK